MNRLAILVALAALATSCSKETPPSTSKVGTPSAERTLVLKVDGMQRGEGGKT